MDYSAYSIQQLAAYIAQQLKLKGIDVVIVGGLAVEFYTHNKYLTTDIDMIDITYQTRLLNQAMQKLGFTKQGKNFTNPTTVYFIEFPTGPIEVSGEIIEQTTEIDTAYGKVPIIKLLDLIKDRLAAYLHWDDVPSLFQALCMMLTHGIKPTAIKSFYIEQSDNDRFKIFTQRFGMVAALVELSPDNIEECLLQSILDEKIKR